MFTVMRHMQLHVVLSWLLWLQMLTCGYRLGCSVASYEDSRGEKGSGEEVHVLQVRQLMSWKKVGVHRPPREDQNEGRGGVGCGVMWCDVVGWGVVWCDVV